LWSDRLLAHLIANAPEFHFGQEVVHGNLQGLEYDLDDIHTLTIKIKKDIEFQRGIIVKAIILELNYMALFGSLKQILYDLHNFFKIFKLVERAMGNKFSFGSKV
jgi:hypothetical protein